MLLPCPISSRLLCVRLPDYTRTFSLYVFVSPFSRPVYNLRSPSPSSKTQNFGYFLFPAKDSSGGGLVGLNECRECWPASHERIEAGQGSNAVRGKLWHRERESGSSSKCRQHCWVRLSIRNRSSSTTQTKKKFPPTPALHYWNSSARALEFLPGIIKEPEAIYSFLIYLSSVAVLLNRHN